MLSPSELTLKFLPQLPGQQLDWESTEEDVRIWDDSQKKHASGWSEMREKNRQKLTDNKSKMRVCQFEPGEEVLVYRQPKSKLDVSWTVAKISHQDPHGYVLTDGSRVASHNVKQLNTDGGVGSESPLVDPKIIHKIDELVVFKDPRGSTILGQVKNWNPIIQQYEVCELIVKDNYSVHIGAVANVAEAFVDLIPGGLEAKPGTGELRLSRPASAWLRRSHRHLLPGD
jgi:hypothetical protein